MLTRMHVARLRYGCGLFRAGRRPEARLAAAPIVGLLAFATLLGAPYGAMAAGQTRPGVEFPSGVASGAQVSVRVAVPSKLFSTTLSLQQLERQSWKTRALRKPRRAGFTTLSFSAPATATTLLLRVEASRKGRRLWISKYVQVPVRLQGHTTEKTSSTCQAGEAQSSPLCSTAPSSATATAVGVETSETAPTIGTPPWWNGECDSGNYIGAVPLGAAWHGLLACGPRPASEGAADLTVRFFAGAWGEYEWECVELSMRWMYLAYGVDPYDANGYDIVDNYSASDGGGLVKIVNGTVGQAPQPGDILELPSEDHTAVITAQSVDAEGNGSITVIQQNSSANGWGAYAVSDWNVAGASGWLHKP